MAEREEGEFELILGNKQLFSVLFIVVVLLGVFFAMGFLAGRSTSAVETATARPQGGAPLPVDSAAQPQEQPSAQTSAAQKAEPPAAAKSEPPPAPAPPAAQNQPAAPAAAGEPPPGRYLQVAATARAEAESMRTLLWSKESLRSTLAPSSKPEYVRVLVGPLPDNDAIATARERLKRLGIENPYVVTYK